MLHTPQVATLSEIRTRWSMDDVFDYNELLDLRLEGDLRTAETRDAETKALRSAGGR